MSLSFGSLFAGIGGIDLGLEKAGMECRWQVEIDPYCRGILRKHWPDVPKFGDIRTIKELPYVDVIAGGFPCQPTSLNGKRAAQRDERWLWPEFARVVRSVRPRFVLVENVTGLLSAGFGDVLGDLAKLGFDAEWSCLPAGAFGAPHIRNRVFIIAYPAGLAGSVLANTHGAGRQEQPPAVSAPKEQSGYTGHPWWASEPAVRRVAHGIPGKLDRVRALGNAVVPQVVEYIGRRLVTFAEAQVTIARSGV